MNHPILLLRMKIAMAWCKLLHRQRHKISLMNDAEWKFCEQCCLAWHVRDVKITCT